MLLTCAVTSLCVVILFSSQTFQWNPCFKEGCTYLLVSDDQHPDNLAVHVSHESLQWHPVLKKEKEANKLCVNLHVCVELKTSSVQVPWIHMKWLHSHFRSNYQFWSWGSDSWGVGQRGKSVQLNSHQSVFWHTCDIPRYSKAVIIPYSSHTRWSKSIIISF